jgi:hypothetical protein
MFSRRNTFKRIVLISPDVTVASEATLSYKLQVIFLSLVLRLLKYSQENIDLQLLAFFREPRIAEII